MNQQETIVHRDFDFYSPHPPHFPSLPRRQLLRKKEKTIRLLTSEPRAGKKRQQPFVLLLSPILSLLPCDIHRTRSSCIHIQYIDERNDTTRHGTVRFFSILVILRTLGIHISVCFLIHRSLGRAGSGRERDKR
jgi:hypothetical protein